MSQYIVSARKYRPESFGALMGQDNIVRTLKNSIQRGQLAHAYLFCGPRGVGKTTAARIFAKMINCSDPGPDMEPCGKCESCISFREGRSYCIHELDAASNNGVEDIKTLMEQVRIPPQTGKYSVYIIDEVHMLSAAAFNAFLKTLEEPPAHAVFIFATTEKHKILPTILSRCQTYDFNRISIGDMVRNLRDIAAKEGVSIDDESLHVIAMKADGAMRDALTIFDQTVAFCGTDVKYEDVLRNLNVLDYEYGFSLVDDFLAGNYAGALLKFDEVLSKGFNALHFVSSLSSHFRNLIVAGTAGLDALLELPDSLKKKYGGQAARCSMKFLYDALGITTQCEAGYRASVNPRLHIEFALMKLSFLTANAALSQQASPASSAVPAASSAAPAATPSRAASSVSSASGPAEPKLAEPKPAASKAASAPAAPAEPQSAAPAPAPSPEPEDAGGRTRRRTARSNPLSITSIQSAAGKSDEKEDAGAVQEDGLPDDDKMRSAWKALGENYDYPPRLANTLKGSRIDLGEEDGRRTLNFYVVNVAQQKWIEEKMLRELEANFRRELGSSGAVLRVRVTADSEVKSTPYMPEEKARDLISRNEEVKNLVTDLGLDIK